MSFTTDEIEAAVEKLVRTEIRRHYGALGNRKTADTFTDTRDAAAGIFILYAGAPFYVVRLAADRLSEAVAAEQLSITTFTEAVRATGRRVVPVKSLSPLSNALSALNALASATEARASSFSSIEDVPSYKRFDVNSLRFLDANKRAITQDGEVVVTPDAARASIGTLFSDLQAAHLDVVRRAGLLQSALSDFEELSLSATLSQSIIENAKEILNAHIAELAPLTPQARLTLLKGVTLDILAARATIRGFGSLTAPTQFLQLEGSGNVFADATHEATSASLSSDLYGPYTIVDGAGSGIDLDFSVDSDAGSAVTTTAQLTGSFVASIEAALKGPYDVGDPNGSGFKTDLLTIGLRHWSSPGSIDLVEVSLPTSVTMTIFEAAKEINTDIIATSPLMPLFAEPYANSLEFTGNVDIVVPDVPYDAKFVALSGTADFTSLGVSVGDTVRIIDTSSSMYGSGSEAFGALFKVMAITTTTTTADTLRCDQLTAHVLASEVGKTVEVGVGTMALRLRIHNKTGEAAGDYRATAVDKRVAIFMPESTATVTKQEQFDGLTTLGLYPLMEAGSRGTDARDLAEALTKSAAVTIAAEPVLSATAAFVATLYQGSARTDPFDFLNVVFYKEQVSSVVSTVLGTVATFLVDTSAMGAEVGDIVVIRSHPTAAQIGAWGVVGAITATSLAVLMEVVPIAATVDIEVGPDLRAAPFNPTLVISGGVNAGTYECLNIDPVSIPIEMPLTAPFPLAVGAGNLPVVLEASLGQWRADFNSLSRLVDTAMSVDGALPESSSTARTRFFTATTSLAVGSTEHFKLPEWSKALEEGDTLELYATQFDSPSTSIDIEGLEETELLVQLLTELPTDTPAYSFTAGSPVPFSRIRKKQLNNYQVFQQNLSDWSELYTNSDAFFRELQRTLNPLAVNTNPTLSQVNDPINNLTQLSSELTELDEHLAAYEASPVEQVDNLIEAFTQKGADRAVAILLEARFSDFFGVGIDELSYAGNLQKNVKEVERIDLPIRKTKRLNENSGLETLIASYEEPDFEFDQSDIDTFPDENLDIPVGSEKVNYPGGSY